MRWLLWTGCLILFFVGPTVLAADPEFPANRPVSVRSLETHRKTALNSDAAVSNRVAAIRMLSRVPVERDEDLRRLAGLLDPRTPLEVQLAAVDAIGRMPHEEATRTLLSNWTKHGPRVHSAVVALLLWREPWTGVLTEEAAKDAELVAALDWARRDIVQRYPSAKVRRRAEKLVKASTSTKPDIQRAIVKFLPALEMKGDSNRGKKMFSEATCADCHKLDDVGRHVGPDLSRLINGSPRELLVETIDPNRVVDHRYLEYTVLTSDGLQIAGMLSEETADSITVVDRQGEPHVVRRSDVDEFISNRRSQMPEGLEGKLTLRQMADLIAFMVGATGGD